MPLFSSKLLVLIPLMLISWDPLGLLRVLIPLKLWISRAPLGLLRLLSPLRLWIIPWIIRTIINHPWWTRWWIHSLRNLPRIIPLVHGSRLRPISHIGIWPWTHIIQLHNCIYQRSLSNRKIHTLIYRMIQFTYAANINFI